MNKSNKPLQVQVIPTELRDQMDGDFKSLSAEQICSSGEELWPLDT